HRAATEPLPRRPAPPAPPGAGEAPAPGRAPRAPPRRARGGGGGGGAPAPRPPPLRADEVAAKTDDPDRRHLPLPAVRRFVYCRDGGRCRFVDGQGRRCPERHRLEHHHRYPYGLGGAPDAANICLMCWTHNRHLAELVYGKEKMDQYGGSRKKKTVATNLSGLLEPTDGRQEEMGNQTEHSACNRVTG